MVRRSIARAQRGRDRKLRRVVAASPLRQPALHAPDKCRRRGTLDGQAADCGIVGKSQAAAKRRSSATGAASYGM
jgi:hypothetical protein